MRIQVYPQAGLAFVGTMTYRDVEFGDDRHADFSEFQSEDTTNSMYKYIEKYLPKQSPEELIAIDAGRSRTTGRCWASTEVQDGFRVNTFHFDHVGDELPWHTHNASNVHTSEVAAGSFTLTTATGVSTFKLGDPIIDWEPGQWHSFVALEAGSVLINRVKKAVENVAA